MGNLFGTTIELPKYRNIRFGEGDNSWKPTPRYDNPMFLHEDSSDVSIFVMNSRRGNEEPTWSKYPSHRDVLKMHIPKLEERIRQREKVVRVPSRNNPEFMEDVLINVNEIVIDQHKPEIVEDVLRYVYERYIRFEDWKNARDVLIMANKYEMEDLSRELEKFLIGCIRLRNACYLLQLAFECGKNNLKQACLEFCSDAAFVVLKTKGFCEASPEAVVELTRGNRDINIENELAVFNALWEWSKTKCIRKQMELTDENIAEMFSVHLKNCVRFEVMDDQQKRALPQCIKDIFRQRLSERREVQKTVNKEREENIRCMKFFEFSPVSAVLVFEYKPIEYRNYRIGDNVTCMRFSINVDSYLLEICTMCEIQAKQKHIKKLKVVGEKAVVFESTCTEDMLLLNLGVKQLILEENSVATVTQFRPVDMLLLPAGVYSIEIEPENNNIRWPLTNAGLNKKCSDVVVNLLEETCGLAKVELLQAY